MSHSLVAEGEIRKHVGGQILARGEDYYERGAVGSVVRRGDTLFADVQGSEFTPYRVRVTLVSGKPVVAFCSCPYSIEWSGWCKHIAAALLVAARDPDEIEEQAPLEDSLAALDADQLRQLLLHLVASQPHVYEVVAARIAARAVAVEADATTKKGQARQGAGSATVDAKQIRSNVRSILQSLDRMRGSDAYWYVGSVVESLRDVLEQAREWAHAGESANALAILEALTTEYVRDWTVLDGSSGETGDFFGELGELWIEALLAAELPRPERERLATLLEKWDEELDEYGIDAPFFAAAEAAREGWDEPHLLWVLSGVGEPPEDDEWYAEDLIEPRLNVLERHGRFEEALRLAETEGWTARQAGLLAKLGRVEEAAKLALDQVEMPRDALFVAQQLYRQGATAEALRLAEHGLELRLPTEYRTTRTSSLDGLPYGHRELALWLRDRAAEQGHADIALHAAKLAFSAEPDLDAFTRVQELAGEGWSELREELLDQLRRQRYHSEDTIEIFLHEGLLEEALDAVKESWNDALIGRVVDASAESHPDRVIPICRKQAEQIMDGGKADAYHHAVRWLERARTAYRAADRVGDWTKYLSGVITKHQRKYKLRPMLEALLRA
jgi:uncharacterized Zn finger protein